MITSEGRASAHDRCELAADIGALECVTDALVRFPSHDGVLHWGTTALLRLTHESPERAQRAIVAGAKDALHLAFSQPQMQGMPSLATKIELAHKWLTMHEKLGERAAGRGDEGAAGHGGEKESSLMSMANKVYKALLFEHATGNEAALGATAF